MASSQLISVESDHSAQAGVAEAENTDAVRVIGRPWPPGVSGNPGGRPKTALITEAYKQILADRGAEELAQVVYNDAINAKRPLERLAAVQEITDRVEGKPVQAHTVQAGIDAGAARILADLAGRIMAQTVVNIDVHADTQTPVLESDETSEPAQANQQLTSGE